MSNKWKEVWNRREVNWEKLEKNQDEFVLYKELKRLDGFDVQVQDQDTYYRRFYDSILYLWKEKMNDPQSVFEVGCGSGANLFLFNRRKILGGGIDYSKKLIDVAKQILPDGDITVGEAINITPCRQYDVVMSDGVFAYFESIEYGKNVLQKMYDKARNVVMLLEIFDKEKERECISHRRSMVPEYDRIYKDLDKIFYPKELFVNFAAENNCTIEFDTVKNEYYWNSQYLYNCYIYKNR